MGQAAARFGLSLVRALSGEKGVVECAYVEGDGQYARFFSQPLLLGKNGAGKSSVAHALRLLQSVGRGVNRVGQLVTPRHFFGGHTAAPMRLEVDVVLQGQNFRYNLALELPEKFKELRVLEERLECEGHTVYERAQAQVSLRKLPDAAAGDARFLVDWHLVALPLILVGVSRSGKTPTSLYLAMQHGLKVANYPLIPEDFERRQLPPALVPHRKKIFGLTIDPQRLSQIRNERRPGSKYADLANCRYEVSEAEAMMRRSGIRWLSSITKSIEEIATTILQEVRPERLAY